MPFTERTLSFLFENMMMDSRDWFKAHREEYEKNVVEPMVEVFNSLAPGMLEIDPEFMCIPQVGKSISRLWRDTRFMRGGSIFRDYIWLNFIREKHVGLPGYYFSVSPAGASWGCGWYYTGTETMRQIRSRVLSHDPMWISADKAYRGQTAFTMVGEKYKKSPYLNKPDRERTWLDMRSVNFETGTDPDILFSPELSDRVLADFKAIAPVYNFLLTSTVKYRSKE